MLCHMAISNLQQVKNYAQIQLPQICTTKLPFNQRTTHECDLDLHHDLIHEFDWRGICIIKMKFLGQGFQTLQQEQGKQTDRDMQPNTLPSKCACSKYSVTVKHNAPLPVLECSRFLWQGADGDVAALFVSYLAIKGSVGKLKLFIRSSLHS